MIARCKSIFARHGIPETVMSDNGPQFEPVRTSKFSEFAVEYGFRHITSSPRFPQSNGFVEATVKIVKQHLKKNNDAYKALLEYRATPLSNGYSPADMLLRLLLPMPQGKLKPKSVNLEDLLPKEETRRMKQKSNYDRHHGVVERQELQKGDIVWIQDMRVWGTILEQAVKPRSYVVETPRGKVRRNSFQLTKLYRSDDVELDDSHIEEAPETTGEEQADVPEKQGRTLSRNQGSSPQKTRCGRVVNPVQRLNL